MRLTVLGSGDAFGAGGRLQTCFHVDAGDHRFLIDCGATALIGMRRAGLDPNEVSTILVTHLHGDHFAGLVWWLLHARFEAGRKTPLTIAGPAGLAARVAVACEALYHGSTTHLRGFEARYVELSPGVSASVGPLLVRATEVNHPSGAPALALRVETAGRVVAFSGDTEWVDGLVGCATGADLYITECTAYDRPLPYHINWGVLASNLDRLAARRVMLTHMGPDMLARREAMAHAGVLLAEDGLTIDL